MATLLCFGLGYCAEHYIAMFGQKFERIIGTVRGAARAAILNAYPDGKLQAVVFDGSRIVPALEDAIGTADYVLVSTPPTEAGDPVIAVCRSALARATQLRAAVYLSTVGVYGDQGGGWVDEQTPPKPDVTRSRERLAAERAWQELGASQEFGAGQELGAHQGFAMAILRLAGIYGPGQNALEQIARGKARRIVKPGQIFNRIHVGDIAQAIDAAFAHQASGIYNVADDEPSPPGDPIAFAAQLMGQQPPPEIAFADAAPSMSPMALSFWQDCRRVHNDKLKRELGVVLRYPTYREGLRTLFEQK